MSPTSATVVVEGMAERRILSTTLCQKRASLREIADTKMRVPAPAGVSPSRAPPCPWLAISLVVFWLIQNAQYFVCFRLHFLAVDTNGPNQLCVITIEVNL